MNPPAYPERGQPTDAEWGRKLVSAVEASRVVADGASRLPGGTVIDPAPGSRVRASEPLLGDANLPAWPYTSITRDHGAGAFGLSEFATAPSPGTEDKSRLLLLVREEVDVPVEGGEPTKAYRLVYMPIEEYPEF